MLASSDRKLKSTSTLEGIKTIVEELTPKVQLLVHLFCRKGTSIIAVGGHCLLIEF